MGWKEDTASTQLLLTANDSADLARKPSAIWVVTTGTVKWEDAGAQPGGARNTHTYTLAAGIYPIYMSKLWDTGTTAVILGLFD